MAPRKKSAPPAPPPAILHSASSDMFMEPMVIVPLDGGYGWVVVSACFFMSLFTDGCINSFGAYHTSVQDEFGKTTAEIALLPALCAGCYYAAGPLWSALGNRYGFRGVGVVGAFAASAAYGGSYFIGKNDFAYFTLLFGVLAGLGSGMVYITTMIVVGFYFERWRGVATSLTSTGSGVGVMVLPVVYKAIQSIEGYTWRWILLISSGVMFATGLLGLLLKPLKPTLVVPRGERIVRFVEESPKGRKVLRGRNQTSAREPLELGLQLESDHHLFDRSDSISTASSRPMYRDDIFYGASAVRLGSQLSTTVGAAAASPTPRPTTLSAGEDGDGHCCPYAVTRPLATLLDLSLLSNSVFMVFVSTQILVMMAYYTPFLYLQEQALQNGMPTAYADWMLPALGTANSLGRVLCGVLCELPGVSALKLTIYSLGVAGLVTCASSIYFDPHFQIGIAAMYGLFIAPMITMKSLVLVDFLGLEKLTNAFGLLLMFQGFAVMGGAPFSGWVFDSTKNFKYSFCLSGGFMIASAILMFLMYPLSKYELQKEAKRASNHH